MTLITTEDNNDGLNERHRSCMQCKKAVVDAKIAVAMDMRSVLFVSTGNGKGKSSSGFGTVIRAMGHNMQVGVMQFIKGTIPMGEECFLRRLPEQCSFHAMDGGYTRETQDRARDIEKVQAAWAYARELSSDPTIGLMLLDESNIALKYHYLGVQMVLVDLCARSSAQRVVITGCGAPPELIKAADTVTDMTLVKHAFS